MHDGHRADRWCRTASVLAVIANCHRDPKRRRRPFTLGDFLPADLRQQIPRRRTQFTRQSLLSMKVLFEK